jgi:glycosyltransferase involved in cell wall biosynthesis
MHMAKELEQDWCVRSLEQQFGLACGRDIFYTPGYEMKAALSPLDVPALYQLWDCLLYLSGGEGFGLPAWEAMCAGLPTIYTNYSGHAELLNKAKAGIPVGGILQPEAKSCIWRMVANVSQAVEAVRRLYFDRKLAAALGANGRAFVLNYTPERIAQKWHSIFQTLMIKGERDAHGHA